jgi:glutathione peroxidase
VNTIHTFKVEGIRGEEIDFSRFAGKKIIVVNVASECGFTPQYQQLQELYDEFQDKLSIVGFPCNDFGGQEPGTNEEIQAFCQSHYGVNFPMAAKISLKKPPPIYEWLAHKSQNGSMDTEVKWNFHKYLLDEAGQLKHSFPSAVSPLDDKILSWLAAN